MFAKARLYHNADKSKLVHEGNEEAAFLYATPGDEIPESAAEMYGLVNGDLPKPKAAKSGDGNKAGSGDADKGKKAGADKSGSGDDNKSKSGDGDDAGSGGDASASGSGAA